MYDDVKASALAAVRELLEVSGVRAGEILVVGCSTSEIIGEMIGKAGSPEVARAVLDAIMPELRGRGVFLAAQCCEHLNRALVLESAAAEKYGYEIVSVLPRPDAGGSFATGAWDYMDSPVVVESIKASAGMDIGDTMIGMHMKAVAVPLRLGIKTIGSASVHACKTRPKLIGGVRAKYPD